MFSPSKQTMLKPPALVSVTNGNATTAIITVYSATAIAAELKKLHRVHWVQTFYIIEGILFQKSCTYLRILFCCYGFDFLRG